jgi:hypothetical protein
MRALDRQVESQRHLQAPIAIADGPKHPGKVNSSAAAREKALSNVVVKLVLFGRRALESSPLDGEDDGKLSFKLRKTCPLNPSSVLSQPNGKLYIDSDQCRVQLRTDISWLTVFQTLSMSYQSSTSAEFFVFIFERNILRGVKAS